ncbi:hypothetical protein [Rhizosphaericola mali]|uniref:Uncharacterized protein n=1 Tax=Rhizosphaericola mali TaxID=2545455 RepID=A0A5P2FWI6_9BACT|nr:hypothetical protein [Rhizosphaericola mali]QES87545.1 hypothetical protein E0W69_002305 [Rhizosphaericola mali]
MNILDKLFLKLTLVPKGLYQKMNVNVHQLECILMTKLEMDDRTPSSLMKMGRRKKKKELSNARWGDFFINLIMGLLMAIPVLNGGKNYTEISFFYFVMLTVLLSITTLSGLAEILLSGKDNFIILPRPVSNGTVALSRNFHVLIRVLTLAFPLFLPGVILVAIGWSPLFSLGLLIGCFSTCFFSSFIVSAFYLILMQWLSPKRLASVLGMLQVIAFVGIYLGFQILPRFLGTNEDDGINFSISLQDWMVFFPSYWYAMVIRFFNHGVMNMTSWVGFALTFVSPFIFLFIILKFLAPSFASKLYQINGSVDTPKVRKKQITTKTQKSLAQKLSTIFTKKGAERGAFVFVWKMSGRLREFKTKVYPMFGYVIFYAVIIGGVKKGHMFSLDDLRGQTSYGKRMVLASIYSLFMLSLALAYQMNVAENFKAAWIYFTKPIDRPGKIILGALKGLLVKYFMPFAIIIFLLFLIIVGPKIIPNLLLGFCNVILVSVVMMLGGKKQLPFSIFENNSAKGNDYIKNLLRMLLIGFLGVGHYLIYSFTWAVWLVLLLVILAIWYIMTSIRDISWSQIDNENL